MIAYTPPKTADHIPVVDLTGSRSSVLEERRAIAWEIHKACRDVGFFYVDNHGGPEALIANQLEAARNFFDLPTAAKMMIDIAKSAAMRGYEPMAIQALDEGSPPDLKEGFMFGRELPVDHPLRIRGVVDEGENQWPEMAGGFRDQMEAYQEEMIGLGSRLMRLLALSMGCEENYFDSGIADPRCMVRLLHYPPQPADAQANQLGSGAHTDWGCLTILLQDSCGGLEVRNADGDWLDAAPVPGSFIINIGDMVPRLTNGLYHSNMHRVLNKNPERHRYSVPTFFDPNYDYRVECVPTFMPDNARPAYDACTVGEHLSEMYAKTYTAAS